MKEQLQITRRLPQYKIEGTTFLVDTANNWLQEKGNKDNLILFTDMSYQGDYYLLRYDPGQKNVTGRYGYCPDPPHEIHVPQLVELDPIGVAIRYDQAPDTFNGKTDFDIMVDQHLVKERLAGKLPVLDLAGAEFIFDYRLSELRAKDHPGAIIRTDDPRLSYSIDDELYRGFYHTPSKQLIDINVSSITEVPKDVVMVEIPFEQKMDPIAHAREHGVPMKEMLMMYPPEAKTIVKTIPIEQTNIPYIVRGNLERMGQSNLHPEKKQKKNKGHKL